MKTADHDQPRWSIRKATLGDLDELLDWRMEVLKDVFALAPEQDLTVLLQANRAYYQRGLKEDSHIALFIELDGQPVGCGALCLQDELPSPDNPSGKNAYLMNIYTRPQHRHHRAAARIVQALIDEASAAGAGKIYLEATPAGAPVYRQAGFVDMTGMMKLNRNKGDQPHEG